MRVALLSGNAPAHNAVGNQIAEKVRFFQERGAEVRLFVQDTHRLHPDLHSCSTQLSKPIIDGPEWDYLQLSDLIFAVYAEYHELLQFLPRLAGAGPRIVFDYLGVTPPALWHVSNHEALEQSARQRGYVWCADHALTTSDANLRELLDATHFAPEHLTRLPLVVDTQHYQPDPSDRWLQRKLNIAGRILLYVGRLAGNKRVPLLIEALASWHNITAHVVIVGACDDVYAEEAERCRALAQQHGVTERVHFLGQLDDADLPRAYRSADVLVMPSLHEGFCVPVLEAMACGLPVIASRSAALPEIVGDAGLTFTPDDVDDLVRQLGRVLDEAPPQTKILPPRRVAIVSFRFGPAIVGGAETSLRTMAKALQVAGNHVEVFTTCTTSESRWENDHPAGTTALDGLTIHRFPIDAHDLVAHGETVRTILDVDGQVTQELEQRYLQHSIHSSALIAALRERLHLLDAIIVGPYLFGLTADIAVEFSNKTLLVPCFHDEALARLAIWPQLYGNVGGILYHSIEEQNHAQRRLGVNHPNAWVIGTYAAVGDRAAIPFTLPTRKPYIAYCGRYSEQKNVPLLVEWARQYQSEQPGRLDVVFMGLGDVKLPREQWLHDLGRVDERTKRSVLAGAKAIVQLSTQESLSLVALEAWAEGTPVIAHANCAVLTGQIARSGGGVTVADSDSFVHALDDMLTDVSVWRDHGAKGQAYVRAQYAVADSYASKLIGAIDNLGVPIREQMRTRGLQRAQEFARPRWQQRFAEFVEQVLTQPVRPRRDALHIQPLRDACTAAEGTRSLLFPVRLDNAGTHAAACDGPGRTVICSEIRATVIDAVVIPRIETQLPKLMIPGQTHVAALPIALPLESGEYRLHLWTERCGFEPSAVVEVAMTIEAGRVDKPASCVAAFLDSVQETLPQTHHLQQLPADYVDVTEGRFASVKRLVKRKLLNNFKHAYVDVLSRQQSQVNGQVVLMIQQLAECCAMLDHAVAGLHERMDGLETKMETMLQSLIPAPQQEELHG